MSAFSLTRAGRWFLQSGIQEPSGGVARFYRSETGLNQPVSTEITGYTASALAWLYDVTDEAVYLDRARLMAHYLAYRIWDRELGTFPFEEGSDLTYFFDCGIIVRGLLAVWRRTREEKLLVVAREACFGMIADFHSSEGYHPILRLPGRLSGRLSGKEPLERTPHWSRGPGCYQLKSALAWFEVAELTGDAELRDAWEEALAYSLATHATFLPVAPEGPARYGVMDRLHAYSYFVEALSAVSDRPECAAAYGEAMNSIARWLRDLEPVFVRSDVYAQLLRARINASAFIPLDVAAADWEADSLASFQMSDPDRRIDGGFTFGLRDGVVSPHINPVSTAFAIQALAMWSNPQCPQRPI